MNALRIKSIFSLLLFFCTHHGISANVRICREARCEPGGSVSVRFPFRLRNRQPHRCGHRDFSGKYFELSCNDQNQTVIDLSGSGLVFAVEGIDYESQSMWISDVNNCLPCHHLAGIGPLSFNFRQCQRPQSLSPSPPPEPATQGPRRRRCKEIGAARTPIRLTWRMPVCRECERRGGFCGYKVGSQSEIGCSLPLRGTTTGLPRSAKYGIIIGVGIPGILCIIGLVSYIFGRVRAIGQPRQPYSNRRGSESLQPAVVMMGLDGSTIESFPKIELGESKRLPKPNDNVCPICLCEYQPKETLRTIPECNHYFHANCVDEWLKLNATCPLCRNSPDCSSSSHDNSSMSASSSSFLSSSSLPA